MENKILIRIIKGRKKKKTAKFENRKSIASFGLPKMASAASTATIGLRKACAFHRQSSFFEALQAGRQAGDIERDDVRRKGDTPNAMT